MAEQPLASAGDELAEVWRALQEATAQASVRVATPTAEASASGEMRALRRAVEALYRATGALAARTATAERQLADLRAAQYRDDRQATEERAPEEPPENTATVDETSAATGRQFDRGRPRRGYGRDA